MKVMKGVVSDGNSVSSDSYDSRIEHEKLNPHKKKKIKQSLRSTKKKGCNQKKGKIDGSPTLIINSDNEQLQYLS